MPTRKISELAALIRYYILAMSTEAGSGHPTSSLSATDLMAVLYFGGFLKFDLNNPEYHNNDRVIFSKGHASPLFYSLYAAAGVVSEKELLRFRKFTSPLEGHPTPRFPFTEAPTGSLGQGLSIGFGMALNAKYIDKLPYTTYVLMGDSEMAEGSVWEAIGLSAYYQLDNLIAIVDVNRLGQRGPTMAGHSTAYFDKKFKAFGWDTITIDGHSISQIEKAYKKAKISRKPFAIIAKTIKGKGVSFLENKEGFHGVSLSNEKLSEALHAVGSVNKKLKGLVAAPKKVQLKKLKIKETIIEENFNLPLATRKAYGHALVNIYPAFPDMVVLDAEVSNSTFSETFKKYYPDKFFEMFIAEQNMVGAAVGLAARGKVPFVSTFAAFFTRAFDQIRMAQYNGKKANIKFVGSHAGVSIGEDGPSQMALEDIAMFRSLLDSVVLYPSDHVSTEKLVEQAAKHRGIVYIRTTRKDTPTLYKKNDSFVIGGSKVLKQSFRDSITVIGAGITLFEVLQAYENLKKEGILIRVIDLYSIKPLDTKILERAARETNAIITVEDHYPAGGLGEAVSSAVKEFSTAVPVHILAVNKIPRSGKPEELMEWQGISSQAIIKKVKKILNK